MASAESTSGHSRPNLLQKTKEEFERVSGCPWSNVSMEKLKKEGDIPLSQEMDLFRNLLLLSSTKDEDVRMVASVNLSFLLMRDCGVRTFLASTFDLDES